MYRKPISELQNISYHAVGQYKWTCFTFTMVKQSSAQFIISRGMEGWVDLCGYSSRHYTCTISQSPI